MTGRHIEQVAEKNLKVFWAARRKAVLAFLTAFISAETTLLIHQDPSWQTTLGAFGGALVTAGIVHQVPNTAAPPTTEPAAEVNEPQEYEPPV